MHSRDALYKTTLHGFKNAPACAPECDFLAVGKHVGSAEIGEREKTHPSCALHNINIMYFINKTIPPIICSVLVALY